MNAKSDIVTVGKGDDEKIYALSHSDITGWTIVGCMNMSELLRNSRQTRSIYVLVAVGLADMWAAIFADVGVMVIAVLNATRALYTKDLVKKSHP